MNFSSGEIGRSTSTTFGTSVGTKGRRKHKVYTRYSCRVTEMKVYTDIRLAKTSKSNVSETLLDGGRERI